MTKLTHQAMIEPDQSLLCAAHYLSGMAKALVEDMAYGMTVCGQATTNTSG